MSRGPGKTDPGAPRGIVPGALESGEALAARARRIELTVNGRAVSVEERPGEMLADLLRERLRLTGTKIGCGEAECGACTVLVDEEPVLSCSYPAAKADGKRVLTIEGLAGKGMPAAASETPGAGAAGPLSGADPESEAQAAGRRSGERLHPLQDAFVKHGAVQCGFCSPGQIMTSYALLLRCPDPDEEQIKEALKDSLCRCGSYPRILAAVRAGAQAVRSGAPVEPPAAPPPRRSERRYVGKSQERMDGEAKVSGRAIYTDDLAFAGMLHARVRRAETPSARVKRIDAARARALPGVVAVLTASGLPGARTHGLVVSDWPILVAEGERVRTVGDALAIVAAESREIAGEALALIEVELEPLPVVTDPRSALAPGASSLHPQGNLLKHIAVRKGDVEVGFAAAEVVLEHTFRTPSYDHAFLEPECSVARPTPEGRMEVYVGSQIPYEDRRQVAAALGWPEERVRVIGQLVGGGFGGKEDIAGQIHAALLAQATSRPVKLLFDRRESLLVHPKRHATEIRVRIGARRDGRLTAVETELYGDTGAYASLGDKVMTRATTHSSGPYEVANVTADCYAAYTNNPPAGAFRGFGVLQSAFAVESAMDMLAERLTMDPVELRRVNALREGSITNTGQLLRESVGLRECIDRVDEEMRRLGGATPFDAKSVPGAPHLRRAWGFAVAYKNTGLGGGASDRAGAEAELYSDGTVEVRSASAELGQGLPTVLQLIAAEELAIPPERVRVLLSDTDLTPDGGPTTASRQTYVTGNAVRSAAAALKELVAARLAELYGLEPNSVRLGEGGATLVGVARKATGGAAGPTALRAGPPPVARRTLTWSEVGSALREGGLPARARVVYEAPETKPLGEGGDMHVGFSFAAQGAEVEVDTRTGEVRVLRLITANDVGSIINPLGLIGQMEGGAIMGVSHALTERFIVEQGRVVTDRLSSYRMAPIAQTPQIVAIPIEHPLRSGPYGAKGVGEIVTIPTPPAIANALYHAVGVRVNSIPIDQEQVLQAILKQGARRPGGGGR